MFVAPTISLTTFARTLLEWYPKRVQARALDHSRQQAHETVLRVGVLAGQGEENCDACAVALASMENKLKL